MSPYADTNFFTRAYLKLPDSEEADRLLALAAHGKANPLPVTWLHRIETINAFQLHVCFAREAGQPFISPEQAAMAHANFRNDVQSTDFLRSVAIPVAELEKQFEELKNSPDFLDKVHCRIIHFNLRKAQDKYFLHGFIGILIAAAAVSDR